jgi:hypothetical protein
MDTITDGEKTVLKTYLANLLVFLFANGKLCGMIRGAVMIVCGSSAKVTENELTQVADALIIVAMLAWSWLEKEIKERKTKDVVSSAMDLADSAQAIIRQQQMPPIKPFALPKKDEIKEPGQGGFISLEAVIAAGVIICGIILLAGCVTHGPLTVNVFSSRMVIASTNVTQAVDGGASVPFGMGMGDAAVSNLATTAKNAFETSSGAKAGTTVATGAAALLARP